MSTRTKTELLAEIEELRKALYLAAIAARSAPWAPKTSQDWIDEVRSTRPDLSLVMQHALAADGF